MIPTVRKIQKSTAKAFGITADELLSFDRHKRVCWPRQAAMHMARDLTNHSLPDIGRFFGGRDHATVLNAIKRVESRMRDFPEFAKAYRSARSKALRGARQ